MAAVLAYIGIGLLVLKGIAPFFSTVRKKSKRREIDEALGFRD